MTPFSSTLMYWVALDFHSSDPQSIARFNEFYDQTHVPEAFARNPGFQSAHRYVLEVPDPRGDFGAEYLAAYEIDSEQAVDGFIARETGVESPSFSYSSDPPLWPELLYTRWRMVYEQTAQTAETTSAPGAIFIVGVDPPADITDAELAEFNDFHSNVHMPEAAKGGGFRRGVRYELRRALKHPEPGCPHCVAVYELDDGSPEAIDAARDRLNDATYSQPPPSWLRHTTPWRLWYRAIGLRYATSGPSGLNDD